MKPTKAKDPNESIAHWLVPIYSIRLLLVVTDSVAASRWKRNHIYGEIDPLNCAGLCSWDDGFRVALFFDRKELCPELIAHEIFHATHRILQSRVVVFGVDNHEPFAYMCGYLTGRVYHHIEKMGERVRKNFQPRKYLTKEPKLSGLLDE